MWTPDQRSSVLTLLVSLGALTLGSVPMACSAEADILSRRKGTDGVGGASGTGVDGGGNGQGGDKSGSGARGSNPDSMGTVTSGGASPAGTAGAAVSPSNLRTAQAKQLVDAVCSLLDEHPCLSYPAGGKTAAEQRAFCSQFEQLNAAFIADSCFDKWAANMKCLASWSWECPCTGIDCVLLFPGESHAELGSDPSRCPGDFSSSACNGSMPDAQGSTTGSVRSCSWISEPVTGCSAYCSAAGRGFVATCIGVPEGPQRCSCSAGDSYITDGPDPHHTAFYADDCQGVAQKMSDGECDRLLDCCFTWMPADVPGEVTAEQCDCTADPTTKGVSTCAELAALGGGKVVDICPKYDHRIPPVFPQRDVGK